MLTIRDEGYRKETTLAFPSAYLSFYAIADAQAALLKEPSEYPFDHAAMFSESTTVVGVPFCNERFDAALAQRLADFLFRVVRFVAKGLIGTPRRVLDMHQPYRRFNGTTRLFMKRFNRLTLCFSKKLDNLATATAMYIAYYNYCRRPRYPDKSGRAGQRRPTPAMAAKLAGHVRSFAELFDTVMPAKVAA